MSSWFRTYGFQEVYEDLTVGALPGDAQDVAALGFIGVRAILNLVQDREYEPGARDEVERALASAGIEEKRINLVDFGHLPGIALDIAVSIVSGWLDDGQLVYLHCRAGRQRSAGIAAAVIAMREDMDIDDAVRLVRSRKPMADPLPHQRQDLRAWWQARQRAGA